MALDVETPKMPPKIDQPLRGGAISPANSFIHSLHANAGMNLRQRLSSRLKSSRRLLVMETDCFSFRTALVRTAGETVCIEQALEYDGVDPNVALVDLCRKFRTLGELPKEAILLTPAVIPAVLELPLSSARQKPYTQMQEMIRWEMEPFFVQQVGIWKIGHILARRGQLTEAQIQEILLEIEKQKQYRPQALGGRLGSVLFGEVAIERGYITTTQRDEALTIQRHLQTTDDEMVCGWSLQLPAKKPDRGQKKFPWLVCGMSRNERAQWVALFQRHRFLLRGIYPLVGCSAAAIKNPVPSASVLMEGRAGVTCSVNFSDNTIVSVQLHHDSDHPSSERVCPVWVRRDGVEMSNIGGDIEMPSYTEGLRFPSSQKNHFVPVEVKPFFFPRALNETSLFSILGASIHAFQFSDASRAVCVPGIDPGPPLWQRAKTWWSAAGVLVLLILGGLELFLTLKKTETAARFSDTSVTIRGLEDEIAAIQKQGDTIKSVRETIERRRLELTEASKRRALLETDIPSRTGQIVLLLNRVANVLPGKMRLEKIAEESDGIQIIGVGQSERLVQRFVKNLARTLVSLNLKIVSLEVLPEQGEQEQSGYRVILRISSPQEETSEETSEETVDTAPPAPKPDESENQ